MSATATPARRDRALWVQCACTALVAFGAAYVSYHHGREFALRFGADEATAAIWPLIVDGLLTTATVELWKSTGHDRRAGGRWAAWLAFVFGICLSLCANVAAAPRLNVFAVAVAACPPLALLLAVEAPRGRPGRIAPAERPTVEQHMRANPLAALLDCGGSLGLNA